MTADGAPTASARASTRCRATRSIADPARERKSPFRFVWWFIFVVESSTSSCRCWGRSPSRCGRSVRLGLHEDPRATRSSSASLGYSFVVGFITIMVSIALMVPTAFWVRLRVPRARPIVEFITLLPFVIPPIVLVFGLISTYSHPPLPFTHTGHRQHRPADLRLRRSCRSRTCTGRSTPACGRWTSRA